MLVSLFSCCTLLYHVLKARMGLIHILLQRVNTLLALNRQYDLITMINLLFLLVISVCCHCALIFTSYLVKLHLTLILIFHEHISLDMSGI